MIHLTAADYRVMPWANGRGQTVELLREDRDGALLWRLSMAAVTEEGPFSLFPGVERNLTVLDGPGFDLRGDGLRLRARPLIPISFPGDVAVAATNVTAPCEDFNVMTARQLRRPEVTVLRHRTALALGGRLALFALGPGVVNGRRLGRHDLIVTDAAADTDGLMIVVRLHL